MEAEVYQSNELNDTTRDPSRSEVRRLVEIECGPSEVVLPGGHLVKKGLNRVYMYESDIEKCRALLADQSVFDEAEASFARERNAFLERERANRRKPDLKWEDVSGDWHGAPTVCAHVKQRAFAGGPMPPLRAIRYVDDQAYPPPKGEKEASTELQMKFMADAMKQAPGGGSYSEIDALKSEIAELRAMLTESNSSKRTRK